jgi:general stress protein 26
MLPQPVASRPFLPGYGVLPGDEGSGLLPWAWAEQRLAASEHFWCATVRPDGRPHLMPIWGLWDHSALWFSTGVWSRKARNLYCEGRVVLSSEDPVNPIVVEGVAEVQTAPAVIARFLALLNAKYETDYEIDFQDPRINATIRVRPTWVFGCTEEDFVGSATCWRFDAP